MTKKKYISLILILGSLTALGPFSIDMYLPGFPAIAADLNTTVGKVGFSLSSFFIGISIGQLIYGPLLDRFGRKKPLYTGLILYIVTSLACLFVTNVNELIALRFLQAIGSCAAGVASITFVRDLFPVEDNAKVFAMLMLVLGASPMVAPTIGGYVTAELGWKIIFVILSGMAFLMLIASIVGLPNTYKPDKSYSLSPKAMVGNFSSVLLESRFYTYAFSGAIGFAGLFAYIASSSFVFMELFKVSSESFGWIFALLALSFIGASQVNTFLLRYFGSEQIIRITLSVQVVTGVIFIMLSIFGMVNLYSTMIFLFIYLGCIGLINPNTSALSLAPFKRNAGTASSLLGALQMGAGALISVAVSAIPAKTTLPMVAVMAGAALIALLILYLGKKRIKLEEARLVVEA